MHLKEEKILSDAKRFFLGQMAESEREAFETAFIADGDAFDLVRVSEDELVEDYVRGILSREDRRSFEIAYLTNAKNRNKVEFTRTLIAKVKTPAVAPESRSLMERISTFFVQHKLALGSAFGILLILGAVWMFLPTRSVHEIAKNLPPVNAELSVEKPPVVVDDQNNTNSDIAKPTPTPSPKETNRQIEKDPETPSRTPVLALFAGTLRSGGNMPTLTLDDGVRNANLSLNLESRDYDRYRAEIVDPDGNVLLRSGNLKPNGKKVGLTIATAKLRTGEYSVRLSGVTKENVTESAADFSFRVTRK